MYQILLDGCSLKMEFNVNYKYSCRQQPIHSAVYASDDTQHVAEYVHYHST